VKAWLSQAGVAYVVRNVDDDLGAYTDLTSRGFRTVPVTFVSARAIVGFDAEALAHAVSGADAVSGRRPPDDPAAP
jgi:glutaredoxin